MGLKEQKLTSRRDCIHLVLFHSSDCHMHSDQPPVEMPPGAHIQNNHCCNGSHHALPA